MKKFALAILIICLAIPAFAQEKTDEELLKETVELAKNVKEFGETLGIEPSLNLSESVLTQKPASLLAIHIQKRGSIDFESFDRSALKFELDKDQMEIVAYYVWSNNYSIFIRQSNEFAGDGQKAVITIGFAKQNLIRKVMTILHEDLHQNIHFDNLASISNTAETLVTPLGFVAALEYFKYKMDAENIKEILRLIEYYKQFSLELNALENEIKELSKNLSPIMLCPYIYEKEIMAKYPLYSRHLETTIKPYGRCEAEEAAITNDLIYWKYFYRVVSLYSKMENLKILINDFKNAPGDKSSLEKYLDELDQKYSPR